MPLFYYFNKIGKLNHEEKLKLKGNLGNLNLEYVILEDEKIITIFEEFENNIDDADDEASDLLKQMKAIYDEEKKYLTKKIKTLSISSNNPEPSKQQKKNNEIKLSFN